MINGILVHDNKPQIHATPTMSDENGRQIPHKIEKREYRNRRKEISGVQIEVFAKAKYYWL